MPVPHAPVQVRRLQLQLAEHRALLGLVSVSRRGTQVGPSGAGLCLCLCLGTICLGKGLGQTRYGRDKAGTGRGRLVGVGGVSSVWEGGAHYQLRRQQETWP